MEDSVHFFALTEDVCLLKRLREGLGKTFLVDLLLAAELILLLGCL